MMFRLIIVVKSILGYSRYTDLKAKRIARTYGVNANARLGFKAMIVYSPVITILSLIFISVIVLAFWLRIF